jgi:hypothetical protein
MAYPMDVIGADLTATHTSAQHDLGTVVKASDGSEYIYVEADSAITQYDAVGITPVDFGAAPLTKAFADAGRMVAFAQVAIASGSFGWVGLKGYLNVRLKNACAPNVPLYTSGSAGMLDDTSASQTRVYGIRAADTATSSGAGEECFVQGVVT